MNATFSVSVSCSTKSDGHFALHGTRLILQQCNTLSSEKRYSDDVTIATVRNTTRPTEHLHHNSTKELAVNRILNNAIVTTVTYKKGIGTITMHEAREKRNAELPFGAALSTRCTDSDCSSSAHSRFVNAVYVHAVKISNDSGSQSGAGCIGSDILNSVIR